MVKAALAPNPNKNPPKPTMNKFTEKIIINCPAMHTIQEMNYPFFQPRLSATWVIATYPNKDPR